MSKEAQRHRIAARVKTRPQRAPQIESVPRALWPKTPHVPKVHAGHERPCRTQMLPHLPCGHLRYLGARGLSAKARKKRSPVVSSRWRFSHERMPSALAVRRMGLDLGMTAALGRTIARLPCRRTALRTLARVTRRVGSLRLATVRIQEKCIERPIEHLELFRLAAQD